MVVGVEFGLCLGVMFNFAILLYYWARPTLEATVRTVSAFAFGASVINVFPVRQIDDTSYIHVTANMGLLYPGIDYLRNFLNHIGCQNLQTKKILLDCTGWSNLDYTSMRGLENIVVDFETRAQQLVLINVPKHIEEHLVHSRKLSYCTDLDELRNFVLETK